MTTVSLRATRSFLTNDVSLDGPTLVNQGTTNTYKITDYNRFSVYTVSSTLGTISISADTITLVMPTTTATQLTMSVTKDNTVSQFIVAIGATAIITPTITTPAPGSVNVNLAPTLTASAFATAPAGADTHQSSQWQVATASSFTSPVFDSGVTTTNKTSISIPTGALSMGTVYYARVRFTGPTIGTSAWSPTLSFTTSTQYVATPTLTMSDTVSAVTETPTLYGTPFTAVNGTDDHAATDWQIIKVSDSSVVWQSLGNATNKTTIKIPAGLLLINTNYRARVRYAGATLGYGGWAELNFTTATKFSFGEYLHVYGSGIKNGALVPASGGILTFGRTLNQYTFLPNQPATAPFTSPADGLYSSVAGLNRGGLSYRPDGQYMVVAPETGAGSVRSFTVYRRDGDNFVRIETPITPDTNTANCAKYITNDILLLGTGNTLHVYQQQGEFFVKLGVANYTSPNPSYYSNFNHISISPNRQYAAATVFNSSDSTSSFVIVWKISGTGTGTIMTQVATIQPGRTAFGTVWSPDGTRLLVTASASTTAKLYSFINEKFNVVYEWQYTGMLQAAFSPDGQYLAIQDSDAVSVLKKIVGGEGYTNFKMIASGDNGASSAQYRKEIKYTADGKMLVALTGEYSDAGQNKQRLIVCDATTEDYNILPATDVTVQNGATRLVVYPAVPGNW